MIEDKKKLKKQTEKIRIESELKDILLNNMKEKIDSMFASSNTISKFVKQVQAKKIDPFEAADKIEKSLSR
jgi:LAO/AO transport system kinase